MPIEIRELHIKAIVENPAEGESSQMESRNEENPSESLIRACVERVLALIKEEKER